MAVACCTSSSQKRKNLRNKYKPCNHKIALNFKNFFIKKKLFFTAQFDFILYLICSIHVTESKCGQDHQRAQVCPPLLYWIRIRIPGPELGLYCSCSLGCERKLEELKCNIWSHSYPQCYRGPYILSWRHQDYIYSSKWSYSVPYGPIRSYIFGL